MARYTDEDFLEHIPVDPNRAVATHTLADRVGCTWGTVNRRCTALAGEDGPLVARDPEAGEQLTEQTDASRLLAFSAAPAYLRAHDVDLDQFEEPDDDDDEDDDSFASRPEDARLIETRLTTPDERVDDDETERRAAPPLPDAVERAREDG